VPVTISPVASAVTTCSSPTAATTSSTVQGELRGGLNSPRFPDRVDKLSGGPGDDLIDGSDVPVDGHALPDSRDQVDYSSAAGPATVDLTTGNATGEGNDTLLNIEDVVGSVHDDVILGSDAPNELNGNAGADTIDARDGDDELKGSACDDSMDGGPGTDVLQFNLAPSGVRVDLSAGTSTGQGNDALAGVENLTGSLFDDVLTGDEGPNIIDGGFGDDVLDGRGGADQLLGDRGDDDVAGGAGGDVLDPGEGDDTSNGGEDSDHLWSSPGADALDGGPGTDLIDFSAEPVGVDADLVAGTAVASAADTVTSLENVLGTTFSDQISGDDNPNTIDSVHGIDEIGGRGGDDVLFGGADRNKDFIAGGDGQDTVDYSGARRRVVVDIESSFSEGTGNDVLIAVEDVIGSLFADDLRGDESENVIDGNAGDAVIDLRGGDDTAHGGDGTDTADGGGGTDTCDVEFASACE
jgi:Ca2+-binding RTX toxin-like protein